MKPSFKAAAGNRHSASNLGRAEGMIDPRLYALKRPVNKWIIRGDGLGRLPDYYAVGSDSNPLRCVNFSVDKLLQEHRGLPAYFEVIA